MLNVRAKGYQRLLSIAGECHSPENVRITHFVQIMWPYLDVSVAFAVEIMTTSSITKLMEIFITFLLTAHLTRNVQVFEDLIQEFVTFT